MQLVKEQKKISLPEAAKKLHIKESTVQAWVDFLVEEHLLGIEYKFTTPYIYVHDQKKIERVKQEQKEQYTLQDYKNGFAKKARENQLPQEQIPQLWKEHLRTTLTKNKNYFVQECQRRGVDEAEQLYNQYTQEVLHEA